MKLKPDLIGCQVRINDRIKYSSHHVEPLAGKKAILMDFDIGHPYDPTIALVEIEVVTVKNKKRVHTIWLDARDLSLT